VQTGISHREWLRDPHAMFTAVEVLEQIAAELEAKTQGARR
jgi:hypothetical protein